MPADQTASVALVLKLLQSLIYPNQQTSLKVRYFVGYTTF